MSVQASNPYSRTEMHQRGYLAIPRWRRELRLLRRDGVRKYVRCALALRRFHRSVERMVRVEGHDAP
jgi:hypothetical protein